jgi:hypothetical protein
MDKYIIAIDPGLLTGASVIRIPSGGEPEVVDTSELLPHTFAPWLRESLDEMLTQEREFGKDFFIVCERFTINAATAKKTQAPWSLEQIGILKQCMRDVGLDEEALVMQNPSDAMKMFDNNALRKVGVWHRGGAGHANDSLRHALLYAARTGWTPRALLSE